MGGKIIIKKLCFISAISNQVKYYAIRLRDSQISHYPIKSKVQMYVLERYRFRCLFPGILIPHRAIRGIIRNIIKINKHNNMPFMNWPVLEECTGFRREI